MTSQRLFDLILERRSYLCVGLDSDPALIPKHLLTEPDPVFAFNRAIIEATRDCCVAYKPNLAFYESQGASGWESLRKTREFIRSCGQYFVIADAKRGDIGNTAQQYARAFFDDLGADALTIAPYMGADSVTPFLNHADKWAVLLVLTSNPGSADFQMLQVEGELLHERVLRMAQTWPGAERLMFVIGATHPERFARVRALAPAAFFLVPGVGAQGGDLAALSRAGMNDRCGLLVNSSRAILYASSGTDFAHAAGLAAREVQQQMDALLQECLAV
jgi:orotidine-5'-phosphate decarboxylase